MESASFTVRTSSREEIILVTDLVNEAIGETGVESGLCTIFTPHTTAAITINENADPDVCSDLVRAFRAMIPDVRFDHGEGNSDAHLLSAIIGPSVPVAVERGRLRLGTWQGIYFVELDGPRSRTVEVHVIS
ncbi:MAG: secondary thiamine-phosphate synthase enzyme YjbQ [Thermoanaerobaculia bacterium]|nr:secondary thiamine-phosphate synthase enzyme YjbQ [Thermoanaerobaculia bacterium]